MTHQFLIKTAAALAASSLVAISVQAHDENPSSSSSNRAGPETPGYEGVNTAEEMETEASGEPSSEKSEQPSVESKDTTTAPAQSSEEVDYLEPGVTYATEDILMEDKEDRTQNEKKNKEKSRRRPAASEETAPPHPDRINGSETPTKTPGKNRN